MFLGYFGRFRLRSVSVAVQNDWTEPKGHFRSVFAVSTQKYGLARQSHAKDYTLVQYNVNSEFLFVNRPARFSENYYGGGGLPLAATAFGVFCYPF